MNINDIEITLVTARVAYQVEIAEGEPCLVDPDNLVVEILYPGQWDASTESRVDGWTIVLGDSEGDRKMVRASGATLADAAAELRRVVCARAATVRCMLGPEVAK